ncbi:MAG: prolyl oligopeptidase family serine peptidase [Lachnospiraceae bacterium]|nr:prolyl oligopeptidase family serine peptidase [Lachnospiraceae bacterium]
MKKIRYLCSIIVLIILLTGCGNKTEIKRIENIVQEKEHHFSCTFDGIKHDFILDLPDETKDAPLVVMLHGYGNTAESFRSMVHFEEEANALGYAVVYVTGAVNPGDSTSSIGWNSGINMDGNDDVGFLISLAKYLQEEYSFDENRTFVVGFSNGAFMTQRLAMEASDTYAAFVSVAGMMPESIWNERKELNEVSFFQITGEKDDVVPKNSDGSAKYANAPAIEDVMEYWAKSNGLESFETCEIGKASVLAKYTSQGKQKQVWHLFVKDGRHSWPDESISGIDTNAMILEFLEQT